MATPHPLRPDARLENEQGYRFRIEFSNTPSRCLTDEAPPLGSGAGPDPAALLAAAVGNCLASSFLFCVRKARIDPTGLSAEVRLVRERDENGRMRIGRIRVELAPEVNADERRRLGRCLDLFESFCVVTESVRRGIPVDVLVAPRPAEKPREVAAGRPRDAVA